MEIIRFISPYIDSNTYIIKNKINKAVIVIDPCDFNEFFEYIHSSGYIAEYIILTHEHYDHISGVNLLREQYASKVICSELCNKGIQNDRLNMSAYYNGILTLSDKNYNMNVKPYTCKNAEILFSSYKEFNWNGYNIQLYETPGHSRGSICILINERWLFTGDSLLKNLEVITRLPGGSLKEYEQKTLTLFRSMDSEIIVYPGHGESFILNEKISKACKDYENFDYI